MVQVLDNCNSLIAWGLVEMREGEENYQRDGNDLGIEQKWSPSNLALSILRSLETKARTFKQGLSN